MPLTCQITDLHSIVEGDEDSDDNEEDERTVSDAWRRRVPDCVEVKPAYRADGSHKGNGLFATVAMEPGFKLLEENPVCSMSMLFLHEALREEFCAHCSKSLHQCKGPHECLRGCGVRYCSARCLMEAWWAHHEVLCSAGNPAWSDFEAHAQECANEYYILAARAVAMLRHEPLEATDSPEEGLQKMVAAKDRKKCLGSRRVPWEVYAQRPWWETMQRPIYSGSSSSGSSAGSTCGGSTAEGPAESDHDDDEAESAAGSGDSSLDRFFVSKVREQTSETTSLLRRVFCARSREDLEAGKACDADGDVTAVEDFLCNDENFGSLVGLVRMNAHALEAPRAPPAVDSSSADDSAADSSSASAQAKGMAMYAVASTMNHDAEPNVVTYNCGEVAPYRCSLRIIRSVAPGDELCIDYLQDSPYSAQERLDILWRQYGISQ
eukprot:TRINITY_DN73304_c0_g1_i1.p1 TRINITY_DN73304_c0_g1~~TRINITY_DN73304_c0_g1_i1.p1  ORF type:complete len:436 (+),score=110.90 TRINITY_DN73304_c0_g1_i1:52-1359(+)